MVSSYLYLQGRSFQILYRWRIDQYRQNPLFVFTANTNDLFIGRLDASQYPFWFNGVIDEIRIYERALCETEVKVLSNLKK